MATVKFSSLWHRWSTLVILFRPSLWHRWSTLAILFRTSLWHRWSTLAILFKTSLWHRWSTLAILFRPSLWHRWSTLAILFRPPSDRGGRLWLSSLDPLVYCSQTLLNYLASRISILSFEDTNGVIRIWEQTTQWPNDKGQRDKQRSTKHTNKTLDRYRGELRFSEMVSSSCSTSGIRPVNIVIRLLSILLVRSPF